MVTSKSQLSLHHWVWNISREQFGRQREVPDSQLCSGESLNCLYRAGLEQVQLTTVPKKGNGGTAIGRHAPLSGHKRNGQDGLAGVNQVSTSGHLLLPNHLPGTTAQLLKKRKDFRRRKQTKASSGFLLTNSMDPNY